MVDEIADSMEQSLFEQQFPQWSVAMTVVALITWMTAPPISSWADWLGAGQWGGWGGGGMGGVSWKWKDGLIRAQSLPLLSFLCPLWLGDWAYWLNFEHFPLKNRSIKKVYKPTKGTNWYRLLRCDAFFIFLNLIHPRRRRVESESVDWWLHPM